MRENMRAKGLRVERLLLDPQDPARLGIGQRWANKEPKISVRGTGEQCE
jgi:hypothetical protein